MTDQKILIADDDRELCTLLMAFLEQEGFQVDAVFNGADALDSINRESPDILVLDVMMPKLSGIDVLRRLRQKSQLPVLMLTARGEDSDRIVGLELGADDYLPKPCNPRELAARIRAILRRASGPGPDAPEITVGDLEIRPGSREAFCASEKLELTSTEFTLLQVLMEEAGRVVKKAELYRRALGRDPMRYDRSIDMHISNLRGKIDTDDTLPARIETVRGLGYQLVTRN